MTKRLFIFAGYDRDNIVDATLIYYLKSLSELGDIVFTMDNDLSDSELHKISQIPNVLHASAMRHGEYDFGSYKRGYIWARDKKILDKYDWVYLVNDSVLGPLFDLETILKDLESRGVDFTGMTTWGGKNISVHIQSWFVGLSAKIFKAEFFDNFITNVRHQTEKMDVVYRYELGLSNLILKRGFKHYVIFEHGGGIVYMKPYDGLLNGVPFIKKMALSNLNGIDLLYSYNNEILVEHIINYAARHKIDLKQKQSEDPYTKIFRLNLFALPLVSLKSKFEYGYKQYKLYLFDKLPLIKFIIKK